MTEQSDPASPVIRSVSGRPLAAGSITWPIVAYVLVRELKSILMVLAGAAVGMVLVMRSPDKVLEAVLAPLVTGLAAHLGRSQPADGVAGSAGTLGIGAGLLALVRLLLAKAGIWT